MRLYKSLNKILSVIATFATLFNSLAFPLTALAQEATPEPTPEATAIPTDTPTSEPTIAPTEEPTLTPEASPTEIATSTPEATIESTPIVEEITPAQEVTQSENQGTTNENSQSQAPPEESIDPTPTITPVQPEEEGTLSAEVIETALFSDTLEQNPWFQVITDKLDYAPTEAAVITGAGFTPGETYSLTVSSTNEPATSTTVDLVADSNGSFTYVYQLDGTYRPNYNVQVKSGDVVIAETAFTDSDTTFKFPTSTHTPNDWDINTVANVQSSDNVYATDNDEQEQGYSNFAFPTIPVGSTINGIEVSVEAKSALASGCRLETRLSWDNGSSDTSVKTALLTNSDVNNTFGGSSDTWGRIWTPSDFTDANFVVKVKADDASGNTCTAGTLASFDQVQAKVYYTEGGSSSGVQTIAGQCTQTAYGSNLQCTANDVSIANVTGITVLDSCDFPGDTVTFTATWDVQSTATERYNVGLYFASQGQTNALTGSCSVSTLANTPVPPNYNFDGNACGDISSSSMVHPVITMTVQCSDPDGDNVLNLPYCTSWNQNSNENLSCSGPANAIPGSPSKCNCQDGFEVPITVPFEGQIEVVKDLVPADNSGTFNLQVDGTNEAICQTDGGTTDPVTVSAGTNNNPGATHSVGETGCANPSTSLSDYTSSISCVDRGTSTFDGGAALTQGDSGPLNVLVNEDDDIVCTITNTVNTGTLRVNKVTDPSSDTTTEFDITATGSGTITGNATQTITGGSFVDYEVTPGTYDVSEADETGWDETSNTCEDVVVDPGQTEECTVTNTQRGHIIVDKVTIPAGDPQNFNFDATGSGYIDFSLSDIATPNDQTLVPGSYSVSETVPTGWNLTNTACVSSIQDTETVGSLDLDAGETITCTFTNTKLGEISGFKYQDLDGNTNTNEYLQNPVQGLLVQLWQWITNAFVNTNQTDTTDSSGFYSFTGLLPGLYQVREVLSSLGASWTNLTPTSVEVTLDAGEIDGQNNFINTQLGNIIVVKYNDHNGNGVKDIGDEVLGDTGVGAEIEATRWEMHLVGTDVDAYQWTGSGDPAVAGQVTFSDVMPGEYTISEQFKTGWDLTNIACGAEAGIDLDNSHTVNLAAGQDLTCYVGNQGQGTIIVEKEVEPDSDATFNFSIVGDLIETIGFVLGDGDSTDPDYSGLPAGTYAVTETPDDLYSTDVSCVNDQDGTEIASAIELEAGETVTCTYTNTRKTGTIIVHKIIDPDGILEGDGATDDQFPGEGWEMGADGFGEASDFFTQFTLADGSTTFSPANTGNYNVREINPNQGGYDLVDYYCDNQIGIPDDGIVFTSVGEDEIVNCTFINSPNGTIHGRKWNDLNGNGTRFLEEEPYLSGWKIFIDENDNQTWDDGEPFDITDDGSEYGWYSFDHLFPGTYSICEELQDDWVQTSTPTCHTVQLPQGVETINTCQFPEVQNNVFGPTCDFGNQELPAVISIEKSNDKSGGASAGDIVTYTLVVTNTGGVDLSSIDVTDILPGGFTYVVNSTTVNGVPFSDIGLTKVGNTLTWNNTGTLSPDESLTLVYRAAIGSDLTAGTYTNYATCTALTRREVPVNCNTDDSDVPLGGGQSFGGNLQGQVLGISTELPATGSPTALLLIALGLISTGFILRKKYVKN